MSRLNICSYSFLSVIGRTDNQTTLLLLIVKTISKIPGAVYYVTIVIPHTEISISATSFACPEARRLCFSIFKDGSSLHLLVMKELVLHLQRLRQ